MNAERTQHEKVILSWLCIAGVIFLVSNVPDVFYFLRKGCGVHAFCLLSVRYVVTHDFVDDEHTEVYYFVVLELMACVLFDCSEQSPSLKETL